MSFEVAVIRCLRGYLDFSGRATRAEYWWFQAFLLLLTFGALVLGSLSETAGGWMFILVIAAFMVPTLAVAVRRLHDIGWSGWWLLLTFLPFGQLAIMIMSVLPGQATENRWGPPVSADVASPAPLIRFDDLEASYSRTRIPRVRPHRDD
ncbi:DUF805 domain-containing protein [Jannaschia sp. M317]|uniref:DUF805 domain-containing protein n=1 Tax=Jannaschia sp. M317 TaxID=2867011 RepID=UPI0021A82654|nr:DUF805 domain-containing protein [Jannaschia sp. M317]UWQ19155.1 DUF805 domain-containing protein [Jannaschia sp. M317]